MATSWLNPPTISSLLIPPSAPRQADPALPELETTDTVDIYHPAVREGRPILAFQAYPSAPGRDDFGVLLGVVLDGCYVVSGNKQGHLRRFDSPNEPVTANDSDPDALLVQGEYIFVVGTEEPYDEDYPLCPSFPHWIPPVDIPAHWKGPVVALATLSSINAPDVSVAVKTQDGVCIMTGAATGLESSHLVPKSESDWFEKHYRVLKKYEGTGAMDLDSPLNAVALRVDLNGGPDQGHFVFAPFGQCILSVFLQSTGRDLTHMYHLKEVRMPARIRRGFLFVRFAWNVFKFSAPGLAAAAAAIDARTAGGGSLKRKGADEAGGHAKKTKMNGDGSWEDVACADDSDDEDSLPTEDCGAGKREDVGGADEEEADLAMYEAQDAALTACGYLTVDDVAAGRYPGFSRIKRLALDYRRAHPEVSARVSGRDGGEGA
ncbi:hypothetical protein DFH09DRAFT_1317411 [Mycena vulgaris]|nr:hypothetical protein DFH09DRAFT_1317411 [Mycena vulgaris]